MPQWSEYQEQIFDWHDRAVASGRRNTLLVSATAGSGKCFGIDTPILRYDGQVVLVQNIQVGDKLIGPDSCPRTVVDLVQGESNLYRIIPTKGDPFVVNEWHIMTFAGTNGYQGQFLDISIADILKNPKLHRNWKLYRSGVDMFHNYYTSNDIGFDPYIMGVWVGDGTTDGSRITNPDPEIYNACLEVAQQYGLQITYREHANGLKDILFRANPREGKRSGQKNTLYQELKVFRNEWDEKTIPIEYLWNTRENRLQLLAGIIDTDGYLGSEYYEVSSKYEHLANQYAFLARSLGLAAYVHRKDFLFHGKPQTSFRVNISGDISFIPCRVAHKQATIRKQIKRTSVTGWSIEYVGYGSYYGFTLAEEPHFLLGDFTVTHNSTTLVEAVTNHTSHNQKVLFLAFNRDIVKVLAAKMPDKNVRTSHSFGLQVCGKTLGRVQVEADKERLILERYLDRYNWGHVYYPILQLAGFCKKNLIVDWNDASLQSLVDFYDVDLDPAGKSLVFDMVRKVLECSSDELSTISFDDMLWLPWMLGMNVPKYDYVGIDESQDASPAQINLFLNAMHSDSIWVGVGDRNQAINGFAGAGITSMDDLQCQLQTDVLPLSITYRCPTAVVEFVNREFPDIPFEAAPNAIQGSVSTKRFYEANFQPGDMILCRTNAPLVRPCFSLIRRGIKAIIKGRDIGTGLQTLIKRFKTDDLGDLLSKMSDYRDNETYKLRQSRKEAAAAALEDKIETVIALATDCHTVQDVLYRCKSIFSDENAAVTFSSAHRSKGLEADNVYILKPELMPHPAAKSDWELTQEKNLMFVAHSRAKQNLVFVEGVQ